MTNGSDSRSIPITDLVSIKPRGKRRIYTADFQLSGRHCRKSLGTPNQKVARQRALELDRKLRQGEVTSRLDPVLIDVGISAFIDAKRSDGRKSKTLAKYETELKSFAAYAALQGCSTVQQITARLIDMYRKHRLDEDKLDTYTIYNHTIILKSWLKWLRKRRLIVTNPIEDMEVRKPRRRRHPAASQAEVDGLLSTAAGIMFAVIAVAAFTGLRLGEIVALRRRDVDLEAGLIRITADNQWMPKTEGGIRDIPIHARLLPILQTAAPSHNGFFFNPSPSRRNPAGDHHLNPRDVNESFKELATKLGFKVGRANVGLTFHSLRRFFKTHALDSGVPKPMVDAWMGHIDASSMDHFYYNSQKSREWMARVPFGEPTKQDLAQLKGASA